jgi:hypothetical protein
MKHKHRANHKQRRRQKFFRSYKGGKAQKEWQAHLRFKRHWHIDYGKGTGYG